MAAVSATALSGGFATPPIDAARAFRAALDAMARPGRIHRVGGAEPPAPLPVAAGVLALVLCDAETPVWLAPGLATPDLLGWLAFQTGAPVVEDPARAAFAFGPWEGLAPLDRFAIGTPEYPDRSATLIVLLEGLEAEGARLTGPGIADEARLSLPEPAAFSANRLLFPLGLDFFLVAGDRLAALPRSTRVEG